VQQAVQPEVQQTVQSEVQKTVQTGRAASYTTSSEVNCPTELQQVALPDVG